METTSGSLCWICRKALNSTKMLLNSMETSADEEITSFIWGTYKQTKWHDRRQSIYKCIIAKADYPLPSRLVS